MKKYFFFIIIFLHFFTAKTEEWPTASIVNLSFCAEKIVIGHYLDKIDNKYRFLVRDLIEDNNVFDTLILVNLDRFFLKPNRSFYQKSTTIENSEELIIFLTSYDSKSHPLLSGFRLLKEGRIHLPFQPIIPGKFAFYSSSDRLTWPQLKKNIQNAYKKIEGVKKIKKIPDVKEKNARLFNWIEEHSNEFELQCGLNENCGWGQQLEWDVFKWITEGGIAADTWKASLLSKGSMLLEDSGKPSFSSFDGVDFLRSKLRRSNKVEEKRQALVYLSTASRAIYEDHFPALDSITLALQKKMQKELKEQLIPLLDNDTLKEFAFRVIRGIPNINISSIIEERYKFEMPSRYRSELAEFLARHLKEDKWKALTGSDANIFIDLYGFYQKEKIIRFYIRNVYGGQSINKLPEIVFVNEKGLLVSKEISDFKTPRSTCIGREIKIGIEGLSSGKWEVFAKGVAGEKNEFKWVSGNEYFEIE